MEFFSSLGRIKIAEITVSIFFFGATLATKYIRPPFRYMLSIPLSICALYGLIIICVPSYLTKPNTQEFFQTQKNSIISISTSQETKAHIQLKTDNIQQEIMIHTGFQEHEILKEKSILQYVAQTTGTQTQVFFLTKNGGIIELFPQSSIEIQGLYPNHTQISFQEGKIAYFIPKEEQQNIRNRGTGEQTITPEMQIVQKKYNNDKISFFKKLRGNPIFYHPISIEIQQEILNFNQKLFPQRYTTKRENFIARRKEINLPLPEQTNIQSDTSQASQEIIKQGKRGREETQLYQRIYSFFK